MVQYLIGGLEQEWILFHPVGNFILPTDEVIFFRGVGIPPTRDTVDETKCPAPVDMWSTSQYL